MRVRVNGRLHLVHRLVWEWIFGYPPLNGLDHLNGNTSDNRLENLREADQSGNMMNRALQKNSVSGVKGVSWATNHQKWLAQVQANNKTVLYKLFADKQSAEEAARAARNAFHKGFANHGNFPEPPVEAPTLLELEADLAEGALSSGEVVASDVVTGSAADDFEV